MESQVSTENCPLGGFTTPRRRWYTGLGVLVLLSFLFVGLFLVARPATADGPTYVGGPIDVPTTWTANGSPYIVTSTVTILDTGSLTITPGVEVRFQWETGLVAEGPLTAIGAVTGLITFTTDLTPTVPNAWNGIRLVGSANTLQHCLVEYAYYGLYIEPGSDHNLVADSQLWLNGHWEGPVGGTILGSTDHSQFLRNQISNSPFGILLVESSYDTIADNEIGFLDDVGIGLQGTASAYGTDNVVTGNFLGRLRGEGLSFLYQSNLTVADNYLYETADGSSGGPGAPLASPWTDPLAVTPVSLPIASGMSLRSCEGVTVTANTVTESGWGDAPTYRAGVYLSDTADLLFDGNFVHLNMGDGLEYAAANDGTPFIHNNGFWDNEEFELESFYPASLDVVGNWWGTDLPLPGVHLSGTLAYTPWVTLTLTAAPTILPANGLAQAELTVTMLDGTGYHAPDGMGIDLATSLGHLYPTKVSLTSGVAVAPLTAPMAPGTAWLTATAPLPPPGMTTTIPSGRQAFAWVSFVNLEPQTLTLTADPPIIPADGVSTSTLRAEVLDSLAGPVHDGTVVVFSTTLGTFPGGLSFTPEPSGVMTTEAESGDVGKVGTWTLYSDSGASGGGGVYSNGVGDKVTYAFTGTAVSVIFQKQFNAGIAHVYLDGVLYREIDTYAPGTLYQQAESIAEGLPYAPHLVEVVVTGMKNPASSDAYLVMDAFRVYGHDRNDAYLTSGGVSTITLTSAITPGIALATACADPACDSTWVRFRVPGMSLFYLPIILRDYTPPPVFDCDEQIENGSFEDDTAWIIGTTPRPARYTTEQAHSGDHSVLLGLKPGEEDVLSYSSVRQAVTLPSNTYTATLTFWYYPLSELDDGDRQECLLLDEEDHLLAILMRTNISATTWLSMSYDVSAYAGQTIHVYFNAYNDGDGNGVTGFYLDDVSLQACTKTGPPPTPEPTPTPVTPPDCYPVVLATVETGNTPHGVAVNSDAHRLYVSNHQDDTLSVINASTYSPVTSVAVGDGPNGVAYNPANDRIYVANRNGNTVSVLRASDYALVKTIAVGTRPDGIAVNQVTNRVYVANYGSGTVSVISGATNAVIQTVPVGAEPAMVAVNPITNKAYVSLHGDHKVAVIDGAGHATPVDIYSSGPYGIAVDTLRNYVYVATIDTFRIAVVDGHDDTFLGWAEIRRMPGGEPVPLRMIAVNPLIGTSGHIFATTAGEDGGWDKFLLLPKGWDDYFARAHALDLDEPREGIAFEPTTLRVFVTSRIGDLVAVFLDGEPVCPTNLAVLEEYQITICVANPDGTCRQTVIR